MFFLLTKSHEKMNKYHITVINSTELDGIDYEEMIKNLKDVDIVYHCAATAHEGLSVFSPNFFLICIEN